MESGPTKPAGPSTWTQDTQNVPSPPLAGRGVCVCECARVSARERTHMSARGAPGHRVLGNLHLMPQPNTQPKDWDRLCL